MGYFSFKRDDFEATTHFEATRSLYPPEADKHPAVSACIAEPVSPAFDLSTAVRGEFPAIGDHPSKIFADGAGGSQVHSDVIAAVSRQMRRGAANIGGGYATSELCLETSRQARDAAAALFNCGPDEVTFGNNMTTLAFHLSHALKSSGMFAAGDNIVLSELEHDANVGPWIRLADSTGCEVRWLPVRPADCSLDLDVLPELIDSRTRLVACGASANSVGSVSDIAAVAALARDAGALSFVDAVAHAPHHVLDVAATGCDFMACSPYKFFGPHAGLLYGRRELMERLPACKIRVSGDELPSEAGLHMSRWELGTQNFEALAGLTAAIDYVASLGRRFGDVCPDSGRREALVSGWAVVGEHETALKRDFLTGAADIGRLRVLGVDDPSKVHLREPTFAVVRDGASPADLASALCRAGIYTTSGNHYASE